MLTQKPYCTVFTGDFNAHSINWWCDRESSNEGTQLDMLFSELGLSQMIIEPTHFREHCKPYCIDLIICDQPNLVIESGVRPSLDPACKHQITFCRLSIKTFRILPFQRLVWHYNKANCGLIHIALNSVQWVKTLSAITNTNTQVRFLNGSILNIMKNFVPSSTVTSNLNDPEWINKDIKQMLKKQKKLHRRYRLSGFKSDDKVAIDKQRDECYLAIKQSKENYIKNLGNKLIDKNTGPKVYWKIINNLLNKCKIPRKNNY